jgi:signal transduction histidine kinase
VLASLRGRLFVASTAVLLCAVALELGLVWRAVGSYFVRQPSQRISASLERADALLGAWALRPTERAALERRLTALVRASGGGLAFVPSAPGAPGALALGTPRAGRDLLPAGEFRAVVDGASWSGPSRDGRLTVQAVPAVWAGRVQGALIWARPVRGRGLARALLEDVLASGLVALILGTLLWAWESERLARPLRRLSEMAGRIAAGDLASRVEIAAPREYAELGRALSAMAAGLEKAEVVRREFLASVAHELRTPLTALRGFLEALGDGTVPPDRAEVYRTKCLDEVARLNRLLDDLLDMAKSEAGRLDLAIRPISLGETVSRAVLLWESAIRRNRLAMRVELPATPIIVEADVDRVLQIVSNLLANAVGYTPAGGAIAVSVRAEGEWAVIAVADSGPGIPAAELERIWDRYYRSLPGGRSRGTGLGLAIVRALAQAHGGRVAARSAADETRFEVYLPMRSPLVARAAADAPDGPDGALART